ncbi:hypothetical protein C0992_006953 [Termitomyces sp. T32_za158]|nr:hypothetical protein C0992_006953 [Termitomyces sp. T32_za158]
MSLLKNRQKMPPLPVEPAARDTEEPGISQWATVNPTLKGSAYAERIIPQLDGKVGDGKGFPAIIPWSVGLYVPQMRGKFGFATWANSE